MKKKELLELIQNTPPPIIKMRQDINHGLATCGFLNSSQLAATKRELDNFGVDVMSKKISSGLLKIDSKVIATLEYKVIELKHTLKLIHKDLLMRAEEDSNGCKVVDISEFIWNKIKENMK